MKKNLLLIALSILFILPTDWCRAIDEAELWKSVASYQYGDDQSPLLTVNQKVIDSMSDSQERQKLATELIQIATADDVTEAGRQYACLQLCQVGGINEVPKLEELLRSNFLEEARFALEAISVAESLAVLRGCLDTISPQWLPGLIRSLGKRGDVESVPRFIELTQSKDKAVAQSSLWALGQIASPEAIDFLKQLAFDSQSPLSQEALFPLLDAVNRNTFPENERKELFVQLYRPDRPIAIRTTLLNFILSQEASPEQLLDWWSDSDPVKRRVAASRIDQLSIDRFEQLVEHWDNLSEQTRASLLTILIQNHYAGVRPLIDSAMAGTGGPLKQVAIRYLPTCGREGDLELLIAIASSTSAEGTVAIEALKSFPRESLRPILHKRLELPGDTKEVTYRLLAEQVDYEAIDSLIAVALQDISPQSSFAHEALRRICDADQHDLPRLIRLYNNAGSNRAKDECERTVAVVLGKAPNEQIAILREAIESLGADFDSLAILPLRARAGDSSIIPQPEKWIESDLPTDAAARQATIRAILRWPNDEAAPILLRLSEQKEDSALANEALKSYIRVITIKSDRSETELLEILRNSMQKAQSVDAQKWILRRASVVRSLDTIRWIAGYLQDETLCDVACQSIVDLAHHRFLRHPNMEVIGPILDEVAVKSQEESVIARAKKYRLGL